MRRTSPMLRHNGRRSAFGLYPEAELPGSMELRAAVSKARTLALDQATSTRLAASCVSCCVAGNVLAPR